MSDSTAAPDVAMPGGGRALPAQRRGADGRTAIDFRAIAALALPLMVNSSLQAVISLTDTWFVGHISTTAMAGMAAIFWLVFFFVMLLGGVGLAVQTFVAQAEGSRRRWRASHSTWVALWGAVLTLTHPTKKTEMTFRSRPRGKAFAAFQPEIDAFIIGRAQPD